MAIPKGYAVYWRNPETRQFERIEHVKYHPQSRGGVWWEKFRFLSGWKLSKTEVNWRGNPTGATNIHREPNEGDKFGYGDLQ
jgi:hypothetical protein